MADTASRTTVLGVRTGPVLLGRVDTLAREAGLTRSEVIRLALVRLDQQGLPAALDAEALRAARRTD